MNKTRTQYALINTIVGIGVQFGRIILSFINRTIFIYFLGLTYLGINGLFTSILSILSLAELGMTTAIGFSLYKPLADKNYPKVGAYLNLFKHIYRIIAVIVFIFGTGIAFFLPIFMNEIPVTHEIILIYFLFLTNSTISYLFTYKKTLLDADQRRYMNISIDFLVFLVGSIIQLAILIYTRNYIFYLIVAIIMTVASNVAVSIVVNRIYQGVITESDYALTNQEKGEFFKSIKGTVISKIAETIVFSTDNLLMSTFISLSTVGLYSNYVLLTGTAQRLIGQLVSSLSGTVGNFIHSSDNSEQSFNLLKRLQFAVFSVVYLVSVGIFLFINSFIRLWLGEGYLMSPTVVIMISVSFFITNYRITFLTFINSYGLFWEQRIKNIVEALLNIVLSLVFLMVFHLNVVGILLGTILSSVFTVVWYEPYTVFKHGMKIELKRGYQSIIKHYLVTMMTFVILGIYYINISVGMTFVSQLSYSIIFYLLIVGVFVLCFHKSEDFKYLLDMMKKLVRR